MIRLRVGRYAARMDACWVACGEGTVDVDWAMEPSLVAANKRDPGCSRYEQARLHGTVEEGALG